MKKFEFSLGHMRDYRERLLDEEIGRLQKLKNERDDIQQQIDMLTAEFEKISREMQLAQQKGTTIAELRKRGMQIESIRMQLKELEKQLLLAIQKVETQTKVVVAANQEVSKLDKLEDRQLEDYREKAKKEEDQRIEELVMLKLNCPDAV